MVATYLSGDRVGAWRQFLASADIDMAPEVFEMIFGEPIEGQAAADERFSFAHMELSDHLLAARIWPRWVRRARRWSSE